jgi:hypothetical protein
LTLELHLLALLLLEVLEVPVLPREGGGVLPDEVDPRAVYGIMGEPIAGNAFVDEESVLLESLVLQLQKLPVGVRVLPKGRLEFLPFDLVCNGEGLRLGQGLVGRLQEEVRPSH